MNLWKYELSDPLREQIVSPSTTPVYELSDPLREQIVSPSTTPVLLVTTVRNSSCGKVMFSQVSVCPRGRGGGVHPPKQRQA